MVEMKIEFNFLRIGILFRVFHLFSFYLERIIQIFLSGT